MIDIVNVSGGVDSSACYLLALERRERTGQEFRAVFADTGNEHQLTVDYINDLSRKTGGAGVQTVRADFGQRIAVRRWHLETMQKTGEYGEGWDAEKAQRVLDNLKPTGIPFLDLCLWKGRFPSTKARFCTQFLKMEPVRRYSTGPAITEALLAGGAAKDVVHWVGIRRDESQARAGAEEWRVEHRGLRQQGLSASCGLDKGTML